MKTLFAALLSIITIPLYAQISSEIIWEKSFGGNSIEAIQSVVKTNDNGFALAGYTGSKGNGALDIWLVKLDKDGNTLWDKTFGGTLNDKAYSIYHTSDGGYILTGYTEITEYNWDLWLIKTDSQGNEEWNKTFGGNSYDLGYCVLQTSDGGYIIGGDYYSTDNGYSDGWLIKTDANGIVQWNKLYGNSGHDFIFDIFVSSDDKYVITGAKDPVNSQSGEKDLWLFKTDFSGNLIWDKNFDGNGNKDFGHEVQEMQDGGFVVVGNKKHSTGKRELWLLKTNNNGQETWNKVLSDGKDALGKSIKPTSDGGFIISGFIDNNNSGDMDFCLIKLDQNLNKEWLQRFGKSNQYEEAFSAHETNTNEYIIGGFTTLSSNNSDSYILDVHIETNPELKADFKADVESGEIPLEVQFTDLSSELMTNITQWEWDFDNDGITDSNEQNPIWTYTEEGLYTVKLTISDGSISDEILKDNYINAVITSINNISMNPVVIYPNPVNDNIHLKFSSISPKTINIYNCIGELILTENCYSNSRQISLNKLKTGIYLIEILDEEKTLSIEQFIKL